MVEPAGKEGENKDISTVQFIIITGLSGAGKSEAVRCFEDMGYFCIDNLPPTLISRIAELSLLPGSNIRKVALVLDVRGGRFFRDLKQELDKLKNQKIRSRILFLQANDETLFKRFKKTRRRHPLAKDGRISEGITKERHLLEALKGMADIVVDTSQISANQLRDKIRTTFLGMEKQKALFVTVLSFGYKYGTPSDADIVIDVRFLPNPHYIDELRQLSGKTKEVRNFVLKRSETKDFVSKFFDFLEFLLPRYLEEGKSYLTIALGCTGGMHRSVTLAEETGGFLQKKGYNVVIRHRDIGKDTDNNES